MIGETCLETIAAREGYVAAKNLLEGSNLTVEYDTIPHAIFTDPEVASVGLTEEELVRRIGTCSSRTLSLNAVPRARTILDTSGIIKMVVNPTNEQIVGVHMVSPYAADLIHEAALAVRFKLSLDDIINTTHVFPTMSESIKLVAQSFKMDISKLSCCTI